MTKETLTDKNNKPLRVGCIYSIPRSTNKFELIKAFDANIECFRRLHDNCLHFGREFIEFDNGEPFVDVFKASSSRMKNIEKDKTDGCFKTYKTR